jgi:hypothetical protein
VQSVTMPTGGQLEPRSDGDWITWLGERSGPNWTAGFDAGGWEDSTWVLHTIYEEPNSVSEATHDDLCRERVAARLETPSRIDSILESAVVIGGSLGMSDAVDSDWVRVYWRELATRLGVELGLGAGAPSFRWFPSGSWPARLRPPDEGSLDRASLDRLVTVLRAFSTHEGDADCVACYPPLATGFFGSLDGPSIFRVRLDETPTLVEPSEGRIGSPNNWWPEDTSWMVYTDYDLWATKVSGPAHLVDTIRRDDALEAFDWPTVAAPDAERSAED